MSVLKQKRTTSKAEFINTANQIYVETLNFLTRLSARYSRLIAEPVAKLAGEIIDHAEKANSIFPSDNQRIEMRKAHLLEARASLMALDVRLTHVYLILNQNPERRVIIATFSSNVHRVQQIINASAARGRRGLYHVQGEPGEVTGCNGKAG